MSAHATCPAAELDQILGQLVDKYGRDRSALIPILQDLQEAQGFLSREAVEKVGECLDLPASKVFGVATFYNQFKFHAPGMFHVQICRGTACHVKGSAAVLAALERELGIQPNQTTRDKLFSLEVVACIGACGLAPVICVNGEYHAGVTPEGVRKIIRSYRKSVKNDEPSNQ